MNLQRVLNVSVVIAIAIAIVALVISTNTRREVNTLSLYTNATYDRVVASEKLRVGYLIKPPFLYRDASSGELSGIFYDFTEELGSRLGLTVEWVEEVGLGTIAAGLNTSRYDLVAFPLWRSSSRARTVAFSEPLFYSTLGVYVRADDYRFDRSIDLLNSPEVTIAAIDGDLAGSIALSDFPQAQILEIPQLSDYSQMLLEVASGKADVTFYNRLFANRYIAQNPGHIREIHTGQPIRVFAETFIMPVGDFAFQGMINATILEMIENGRLEHIFEKYNENYAEHFRTLKPFRDPVRIR